MTAFSSWLKFSGVATIVTMLSLNKPDLISLLASRWSSSMGLAAATRTCVLWLTRILRGVAIQVEDGRREGAAGDEHDGGEHRARATPSREDVRERR